MQLRNLGLSIVKCLIWVKSTSYGVNCNGLAITLKCEIIVVPLRRLVPGYSNASV